MGTWSHSGLQGSVNVHRCALLLVPQWQYISSFVFYSIAFTMHVWHAYGLFVLKCFIMCSDINISDFKHIFIITNNISLKQISFKVNMHFFFSFSIVQYYVKSNTEDGLIFVRYQFSWFSWRAWSTNSSTHEFVNFHINYEGKYYGLEFWTPRMCHFRSIHENWYPRN